MAKVVSQAEMVPVYEALHTPVKLGFVLREDGVNIDCASVFRAENDWRMIYARQDPRVPAEQQGYETWMARSDDLIHWQVEGQLLRQTFRGWDGYQADGGILLIDPEWGGSQKPERYEGRYYMSYFGGGLPGYETDPLHIGLASAVTIDQAVEWERLPQPILRQDDTDTRVFERATLYKSCVIRDPNQVTGHPFIMYYNAKRKPFGIEAIGMAVSDDLKTWMRYGSCEIMDSGLSDGAWSIAGDPQIVRIGELWVMNFFIAGTPKGKLTAYDTFACSRNLVTWTRWAGEPLVKPSQPFDSQFAHKPFLLRHEGIVYHFYCAVGEMGRGLALAVSEDPRGT